MPKYTIHILLCVCLALVLSACRVQSTPPVSTAPVAQAPESAPAAPAAEATPAAEAAPAAAETARKPSPYEDSYTKSSAVSFINDGAVLRFVTQTADGTPLDSETFFAQADYTLVNIWATWCGPCMWELPYLGELARQYEGTGFQFIGIPGDIPVGGTADELSVLQNALQDTNVQYTQALFDEANQPMLDLVYSAFSVPTTYIVDSTGKAVCNPFIGAMSQEDWVNVIETVRHGA